MTNTTIEALKNKQKLAESSLHGSSTAYARDTAPTKKDVSTAMQLAAINKQIESLRSKQIRSQWYGPDDVTTDDAGDQSGFFMKGLKGLQKPLSAVMGAGQYALGKGTETGLVKNINEAMKKGLVAGDILEQYGAPRGVQIPLGFALDVMFDPINWMTAGTAALIPRVGWGAVKGGLKGAGLKSAVKAATVGATSSLEKKAAMGLGLVPFAKRIPKYKSLVEKLGTKAIAGADKYDTLVGKTVYDKLGKGVFGMPSGVIGKTIEKQISKIPSVGIMGKQTPTGEAIVDFFKYSTKEATEIAKQQDLIKKLAKNRGLVLVRTEAGAHFVDITDVSVKGVTVQKDLAKKITGNAMKEADEIVNLRYSAEDIAKSVGKQDFVGKVGDLKPEFMGRVKVYDSLENAKILLRTAGEDFNLKHLEKGYKETPIGKTGYKWYDNKIDRFKNTTIKDLKNFRLGPKILKDVEKDADVTVTLWNNLHNISANIDKLKPFEKILKGYETYLPFFKHSKVAMNPGAFAVAIPGNFVMGEMMGIPTHKIAYFNKLTGAYKLVSGKMDYVGFKEMFLGDLDSVLNPLLDLADNNPTMFQQATGINANNIADRLVLQETLKDVLSQAEEGVVVRAKLKKMVDAVSEALESGTQIAEEGGKVISPMSKKLIQEKVGHIPTPSEQTMKLLKQSPLRRGEEIGSWTSSEIHNLYLDNIKQTLAKAAKDTTQAPAKLMATKFLNVLVNKMPRSYEHIDQSFKLATVDYLTKIGLNEERLVMLSRHIDLKNPGDILDPIIEGGEKLFRISPVKAAEAATEAFMNYAAMPDFVRMMRAVPIVGAPFLSFPYAMAIKTAKTAINNPAIFNKIGFMIDEMNAGRTPEEKIAMEEKYNKYLNSPTVVKMLGMWNTNVKNIVPYYTMNMFNPSERTYDNSFQGQMFKMLDKFPMLQEPTGQVLKDYFLQPWILSRTGQISQGQFGQPLYPAYDEEGKKIDVGLGTKAFYAGRTVTEALVPGVASYLGLPLGLTGMSPEAIDYLPSYGIRNIANATQGRSTVGAMTKENVVQKTLRAVLGRTGIPAYTLDTTRTLTR